MQVVFFSNYLNHHQLPFCFAMCELTNNNFTFVATEAISQKRLALGYEDMDSKYPFVLKTYDNVENEKIAMDLALNADLIITGCGSSPEKYTVERVKQNKITFRYSERIFKEGLPLYMIPRYYLSMTLRHGIYKHKPLYMLCCSNFTCHDFVRFGAYKDKCYRWGYFPETSHKDVDELIAKKDKNEITKLLWVGRLIDWKHCEMAIELAKKLKKSKNNFSLDIIGNGELEEEFKKLINDYDLNDNVKMLGSKKNDEVREYMEQADIFLFTSDFNEGWGAVLNEAMASACAVIASHAAGSTGFLIKHKENGIIFESENQNDLDNKVLEIINDKKRIRELGFNAYQTLANDYNAKNAAKRILALTDYLIDGKTGSPFKSGVCSVAPDISNDEAEYFMK